MGEAIKKIITAGIEPAEDAPADLGVLIDKDNYYSFKSILSSSTLKAYEACEYAAEAEQEGYYQRPTSTALLVGSYIDAALDSEEELSKFLSAHPEIINSRTGEPKSDFKRAEEIVERCLEDDLFSSLTISSPADGHQYIVIGDLGNDEDGVPMICKGKLDFLLQPDYLRELAKKFTKWRDFFTFAADCGGLIVDLKSAANTDEAWDEEIRERVPWLQQWHYDRQLSIYQELYRQQTGLRLPVLVIVCTKEPATSLLALSIDQGTLDEALEDAKALAPAAWDSMHNPDHVLKRCGKCPWCRSQRRLADLGPMDFRFAADF